MSVKDEDLRELLVIVCDTATPRIDDKRYLNGDFPIKIDQPNDDAYGDLLWVDTDLKLYQWVD